MTCFVHSSAIAEMMIGSEEGRTIAARAEAHSKFITSPLEIPVAVQAVADHFGCSLEVASGEVAQFLKVLPIEIHPATAGIAKYAIEALSQIDGKIDQRSAWTYAMARAYRVPVLAADQQLLDAGICLV